MLRIELRHCDVKLRDGLAGTAVSTAAPTVSETTLTLDTVSVNTINPNAVPVGTRFTVAGETVPTVHVVTARTPALTGPTTAITFPPALGAGTYAAGAAVTFAPQELSVKIGDGDLKYSEASQYHYDLDRGLLDSVRDGDEVPLDVSLNFTWTATISGTSESITPMEAIKQNGAASEWVSTGGDCEPYAVDLVVVHTPICGSSQPETYVFPQFRSEKRGPDFKSAAISIDGKCNATEPTITRG